MWQSATVWAHHWRRGHLAKTGPNYLLLPHHPLQCLSTDTFRTEVSVRQTQMAQQPREPEGPAVGPDTRWRCHSGRSGKQHTSEFDPPMHRTASLPGKLLDRRRYQKRLRLTQTQAQKQLGSLGTCVLDPLESPRVLFDTEAGPYPGTANMDHWSGGAHHGGGGLQICEWPPQTSQTGGFHLPVSSLQPRRTMSGCHSGSGLPHPLCCVLFQQTEPWVVPCVCLGWGLEGVNCASILPIHGGCTVRARKTVRTFIQILIWGYKLY